jgi:hypothetical protein
MLMAQLIHRHHTPQAVLLGLEGKRRGLLMSLIKVNALKSGSDPETIDTGTIPSRYQAIIVNKTLLLGGKHRISYDMDRDMLWRWDQVLPTHPNGMRFACFGENGDMLAMNEYFRYVLRTSVIRQGLTKLTAQCRRRIRRERED